MNLLNDFMSLTPPEMLATIFKFVMPSLGWEVWDSLLDVDKFAKIVALIVKDMLNFSR